MKIAIITNGNVKMGMGHVYRSMTLANELKKFNVNDITFFTKSDEDIIKKIKENGFKVIKYNDDNILEKIKNIQPEVILIDNLSIEEDFAKDIKGLCKKLIFFDNLNHSSNKYADVVVNATIVEGLKNRKYYDEENKTLYFYGPRYLILRNEFYKVKNEILDRDKHNNIENILITFGGSDPSNLTCKVLGKLLSDNNNNFNISIVLGPKFQYEDELNNLLKRYGKSDEIKIYKNVDNIAELMKDNDLIMTSPGMTMFEALFLGIPVFVMYQNELQMKYYGNYLKKISKTHLNPLKEGYFIDAEYADLYIGKGKFEIIESITNICNHITKDNFQIVIRQIADNDLELLMAWRSNPLIYKFFYVQNEPLRWNNHYSWWISRENRVDWIILLKENNMIRKVGSVNASRLDTTNPEIGIFIGELFLWGKHIGRCSVLLVIRWLKNIGYKKAHARILKNNIQSIKLFESLGFKKTKKGRENEWIYEIDL